MYGKAADGLIHVHHLRELSGIGKENVVDPVKDLRPVCRTAARSCISQACLTIEEMKDFLRQVAPRKEPSAGGVERVSVAVAEPRQVVADRHGICPKCGSIKTIPVIYGYASPEVLTQLEKGLIKLGGCCLEAAAPDFSCKSCGHEWKKGEIC